MKLALQNPMQAVKQSVKKSLYKFIRYFWDTYSEDKFVENWHIQKICEELEKVARNVSDKKPKEYDLIINVPPGTTKTATGSIFFPIWCWVNWHWIRFITTSHSDPLSLESAEYSRDIIRSDKFKAMFPELEVKQDKDTKSNFRVVKKEIVYEGRAPRVLQGGGRISTSVKGSVTGFHAHILIADDLSDPRKAVSEAEIKTVNHYWDHTLSQRKTDRKITVRILIMQRLSESDVTGHELAKKKDKLKHICLPGVLKWGDQDYSKLVSPKEYLKYYTADGLFDKNRLGFNELKEAEADLGQYGFAGQIGQTPAPPGGGMFKVDKFMIMDRSIPDVNIVRTVRYWDKAGTAEEELKKGQEAAYTCGTKISLMRNGKWFVHDRVKGRWGTDERERVIKSTAEADGRNAEVWIEQEPGSGGKDSAKGTILNLAGFHVEAERPSGDKVTRADPYSVQVNEGNVWLQKGDWNKDFKDEHKTFPFGKFKDQVDSAAGAFNQLTQKKTAWIHKR